MTVLVSILLGAACAFGTVFLPRILEPRRRTTAFGVLVLAGVVGLWFWADYAGEYPATFGSFSVAVIAARSLAPKQEFRQ
jgi:hypothetical protein